VYPAPIFDAIAAYGIGLLALVMAAAVVWACGMHRPGRARRMTIAIGAWMVLTAGLATKGVLSRADLTPPPMALLIAGVVALSVAIGVSPFGGRLAHDVPLTTLVALQMFRLPLELVMHRAATLGIMPNELSYTGYNLDIVTGTGAVVLFIALQVWPALPRAFVWAWNLWGLWCLMAIVVIAVTTAPMVRAFGDDPRHINTWVLFFPYVWLPAVLVPIAIAGHLVVTRALLAARPAHASA
jgi:hypothetical protein